MNMKKHTYKTTKLACYVSYFTMSSVFSLPPVLLVTFREMYGISYTLLGTLVLTNFCTQFAIDLIFTLFSKHFNVGKIVRAMPLITSAGLAVYALIPTLFPQFAFAGLMLGTVIFSVSAGLSEVLLSPMIAAIPSDNPQKDMSMLHSLYAFGVFTMVALSTLFLRVFGTHNWMYLTFILALLPVVASVMFFLSPIPDMSPGATAGGAERGRRRITGLALCTACIFFGSCAENVMSNWLSGYLENAMHIDKALGDILGLAMFAVVLGLTRIGYAKFGRNIIRVLLVGMAGAVVCYLVAGLASGVAAVLVACVLTGMFTSMLWPGTLIMMEENFPGAGVMAYALMAAGGDLGASLAPQLMGIVVDTVSGSGFAAGLAHTLSLSPEQIGMKAGMVVTAVFPLLGAAVLLVIIRYLRRDARKKPPENKPVS